MFPLCSNRARSLGGIGGKLSWTLIGFVGVAVFAVATLVAEHKGWLRAAKVMDVLTVIWPF
jgi:lipid-A-disaccharide synthase-like uncharacterized protein